MGLTAGRTARCWDTDVRVQGPGVPEDHSAGLWDDVWPAALQAFPLTGHALWRTDLLCARHSGLILFLQLQSEMPAVDGPAGGPHTYPASQPSQRSRRSSRSLRPHTSQKVGSSSSSSLALALSTGIWRQKALLFTWQMKPSPVYTAGWFCRLPRAAQSA